MNQAYEYSGLCMNCTDAPRCSYRMNHPNPILFCEEFHYEKGESVTNLSACNVDSDSKQESGKYSGLCINCEKREVCPEEKVKSGIVHCGEYR